MSLFPPVTARGVSLPLAALLAGGVAAPMIIIKPGDTLWGLSRQHGTTVDELKRLNGLQSDLIRIGDTLKLPGASASAPLAGGVASSVVTVRPGDTLSSLAQQHGTTVDELKRLNGLPSDLIRIGDTLKLPGTATGSSSTGSPPVDAAASAKTSPVKASAAAHRAALAKRSVPSRSQVQQMISTAARAAGVDPALALAIAYQESGFNQRVVSDSDAIGVMQLIPSTVEWMSTQVLRRQLDPLDAADNIAGGVALLKVLTSQASVRDAIGGYYQGLASIRARGPYQDTVQYVDNVLALRERFA